MSWDAAMFGTLEMPAADVKGWLASDVDSSEVPNAEKYLSTAEVNGQTVKKTLAEIERFRDREGLAFIEISRDPARGSLEVRSFVSKDEYLRFGLRLAMVWAAARGKASGELYFAGMLTAGFCYRLTVGPKGVTLDESDHRVVKTLPAYKEILARVEKRIEELGL